MDEKALKKPRSGKRKFLKIFFFCFILICLIAVGAGYYFFQQPFGSDIIQKRVVARLERISGMKVKYDEASLDLKHGLYRIDNLRFYENDQFTDPLFSINRLDAEVSVMSIRSGQEAFIEKVLISSPSRLDVVFDGKNYSPSKKLRFLIDTVSHAQSREAENASETLPFEKLKIENLQLGILTPSVLLPTLEKSEPASIVQGTVSLQNGEDQSLELDFNGGILSSKDNQSTEVASGLSASMKLIPQAEKLSVRSSIDLALLQALMPNFTSGKFEGRDADLSLEVEKREGKYFATYAGSVGELEWIPPQQGEKVFSDSGVQLAGKAEYNPEQMQFDLDTALDSNQFSGKLSVQTNTTPEKPYRISMDFGKFGLNYRQFFSEFLPPEFAFDGEDNSVSGTLTVVGDEEKVSDFFGAVDIANVKVKLPQLSKPLELSGGHFDIRKDKIQVSDAAVNLGKSAVKVNGSLTGNYLEKQPNVVDLRWNIDTAVEELVWFYGQSGSGQRKPEFDGKGRVVGNGSYQQTLNFTDPSANSLPAVKGKITVQNATFRHTSLPVALSGISADISVTEKLINLDNVKADAQGADLQATGRVFGTTGSRYVWNDPQVSATIALKANVEDLTRFLTEEQKKKMAEHEVKGRISSVLSIDDKVDKLAESALVGDLVLSNVGFNPKSELLKGSVSDLNTVLKIGKKSIDFTKFSADVAGQKLSGEISLGAEKVDAQLEGNGDAGEIVKLFPNLNELLNASGKFGYNLKFSANGPGTEKEAYSPTEIVDSATAIIEDAIGKQNYKLNGSINLSGVNLRHIVMPPARTEKGNSIPEGNIRGLTGTVTVSNNRFTVADSKPLSASFANTTNCRLSGDIELREGNMPKMSLKISTPSELKLDTWVMGWGKELRVPSGPPLTGKRFDLDVDISAGSMTFRGQKSGRSRGLISFRLVQDKTPRVTTFNEIVIQGRNPGEGRIIGSGRIESFVWDKNRYPAWSADVDVQQMPLEGILASVFKDPANVRGRIISGRLGVRGISDNPLSIAGSGNLTMTNLELGGSRVIRQIGQTSGRNLGGTLFETAHAATFEIGNGALSSRDLALQSNGLQMAIKGDYFFATDSRRGIPEKTINGAVQLKLFKSVFGSLPIISNIAELADDVTNAFLLAFRIEGTSDVPRVTPVAIPLFQGF